MGEFSPPPPARGRLEWTLLLLALFASFSYNLLPTKFYRGVFVAYALRSLPFFAIWLHCIRRLWREDFAVTDVLLDYKTLPAADEAANEAAESRPARLELRATFYTTANFALHRTDLVRRIVAGGHEVASHDYYHGLTAGSDPAGSRRTLEELTGQRIVGYRAPRLAAASSAALAAAGYRYNSSINPTWIPTRYNNLRAPCSVSREEGLTIYPVSVSAPFRVPLFWISLHVMPLPLYKLLCRSALRRDGHLNLYFHPWEFSARLREPAFGVPGYLTHCSGTDLQRKFIRLLEWLKARGCRFLTTREYLGCDE